MLFDVNGPENTDSGRKYGNNLPTLWIINEIREVLSQVLCKEDTPEDTKNKIITLNAEIINPSLFRGNALDKIFLPPPREDCSVDRNGPSICVYDKDGQLDLVNGTYLHLAGLQTAEQAKQLVREGKLLDTIYEPDTICEIELFSSTIADGGYRGKTFPLKHTNEEENPYLLRWTSLPNARDEGNVRVAEDVTGISDLKKNFPVEGISGIPFGFLSLIEKFRQRFSEIMGNNHEIGPKFEALAKIANIGDIIVDQGPFCIVMKQGNDFITMNPAYVATSGYSVDQLLLPEIQDRLYSKSEKAFIQANIATLRRRGHYHGEFEMVRADGSRISISWDTSLIANDITIRIGSMAEPNLDVDALLANCIL